MLAELVREQVLRRTRDELPHAVEVEVDDVELREDGLTEVNAQIWAETESQKGDPDRQGRLQDQGDRLRRPRGARARARRPGLPRPQGPRPQASGAATRACWTASGSSSNPGLRSAGRRAAAALAASAVLAGAFAPSAAARAGRHLRLRLRSGSGPEDCCRPAATPRSCSAAHPSSSALPGWRWGPIGALYVGDQDGEIYRIDLATGATALFTDIGGTGIAPGRCLRPTGAHAGSRLLARTTSSRSSSPPRPRPRSSTAQGRSASTPWPCFATVTSSSSTRGRRRRSFGSSGGVLTPVIQNDPELDLPDALGLVRRRALPLRRLAARRRASSGTTCRPGGRLHSEVAFTCARPRAAALRRADGLRLTRAST